MPSSTWSGLSRNGRFGRGGSGAGAASRSDGEEAGLKAMCRPRPYGMNVKRAIPLAASRPHGQKKNVTRGRVRTRTRT